MKQRKMIDLPQPKVRPGDPVMVENYRRRNREWERGRVVGIVCHVYMHGTLRRWVASWHYTVRLDRDMPLTTDFHRRPTVLHLTVGDDAIDPAPRSARRTSTRTSTRAGTPT